MTRLLPFADDPPSPRGGTAVPRAERELRDANERLSLALAAGRAGTFDWSIPDDRVFWTPELEDLFGLSRGTFGGTFQAWADRVEPADARAVAALINACLLDNCDEVAFEFRAILPDGRRRWMSGRARFQYAPDGRPLRMIGINVDIDAAKRNEDELREADRRKDEFLATLAHELRNPLAPIRNAVEVLVRSGASGDAAGRLHAMIGRQVGHMARLIDDLLDVSRIVRGKVAVRRQPCDLVAVVRQSLDDHRPLFDAAGIDLDVRLPDGRVPVSGDPVRLAQVVGNVLHNAHKFTDRGGRVTIALAAADGTVALAVRDTGVGMDAETVACAFEPFAQGAGDRGGLGLGLALVRGLAALHGGSADASSDGPGQGSEVRVRLPLDDRPDDPMPDDAAPATGGAGRSCRVLVIEDNRDSADSMAVLLELLGHAVDVAYDGPTGVAAARRRPPDVVLCDVGLPAGMTGYDVARAVRPHLPDAVLVAVTGYGRDQDVQRAVDAGFDRHLVKPIGVDDLQSILTCD